MESGQVRDVTVANSVDPRLARSSRPPLPTPPLLPFAFVDCSRACLLCSLSVHVCGVCVCVASGHRQRRLGSGSNQSIQAIDIPRMLRGREVYELPYIPEALPSRCRAKECLEGLNRCLARATMCTLPLSKKRHQVRFPRFPNLVVDFSSRLAQQVGGSDLLCFSRGVQKRITTQSTTNIYALPAAVVCYRTLTEGIGRIRAC